MNVFDKGEFLFTESILDKLIMKLVKFVGCNGTYASFQIERKMLPNGNRFERLLVAHEGDWIGENGMMCYPEYKFYEDVQTALGKGLVFVNKEYSDLLRRTLFLYDFERTPDTEYVLSVPATGEEIYFEIYGIDHLGAKVLLLDMEL